MKYLKALHIFFPLILSLTQPLSHAAGQLEVKIVDGHVSPLMVELTYADNTKKKVMLRGFGYQQHFNTHNADFIGKGNSKVNVWFDTLSGIKEINNEGGLFIYKDGKERDLKTGMWFDFLYIQNPEGATEELKLSNIKALKFLQPPKKDKDGNAMFDEWRYSPWTGERINKN